MGGAAQYNKYRRYDFFFKRRSRMSVGGGVSGFQREGFEGGGFGGCQLRQRSRGGFLERS